MAEITQSQFAANLKRYYSFYTGGFVAFVILVGILEQMGVPNKILGYIFLFATIALYAGIGFMSKTADVGEYYVAGRRVPACSTAWRPAPTGCPPPASSAWPARST
jgi:cation/acetate symporter